MVRKLELPSQKHNIAIYDEDWEFLSSRYGRDSSYAAGVASVIRRIIHGKVKALRAREEQIAPGPSPGGEAKPQEPLP